MKNLASYAILATAVILIALDVYLYATQGNAATLSATTWRAAWQCPPLATLVGILIGHLFLQNRAPSKEKVATAPWKPAVQLSLLLSLLVWVAWDDASGGASGLSGWLLSVTGHIVPIMLLIGMGLGWGLFQMDEETE